MPKVKSDKEKPAEKAKFELFGKSADSDDTAIQGLGFKDKEKALETLRLLHGRDVTFQQKVIGTMYRRAQSLIKRTKDQQKIDDMTAAVAVFEKWLDDYKANNRSKENFNYLPYEVVSTYIPLAKHYQQSNTARKSFSTPTEPSDVAFHEIYCPSEGDIKKLRTAPIRAKKEEEPVVTWDIFRNRNIRFILDDNKKLSEDVDDLYHREGPLQGLPIPEHVSLIMWGYSPDPSKVKKSALLVADKLDKNSNAKK